jgi:hypothetical protein
MGLFGSDASSKSSRTKDNTRKGKYVLLEESETTPLLFDI